jgi:hypothetical protein
VADVKFFQQLLGPVFALAGGQPVSSSTSKMFSSALSLRNTLGSWAR